MNSLVVLSFVDVNMFTLESCIVVYASWEWLSVFNLAVVFHCLWNEYTFGWKVNRKLCINWSGVPFCAASKMLFWPLFPVLRNNIETAFECVYTVRRDSTHVIAFLTGDSVPIHDDGNTILTYQARVSLARITFCWWHHNRLLMTSAVSICDVSGWKATSNSSDIDCVHRLASWHLDSVWNKW